MGERVQPAPTRQRIRVLIVAGVRLYREGLATTLASRPILIVAGTAEDAAEALKLVRSTQPDVTLLDMAAHDSLEISRAISKAAPLVKIIAFAIEELDGEILACAEAGAAGYLTYGASMEDLVEMIEEVMRGELVCPPRTVSMLFRRLASLAKGGDEALKRLDMTAREREVVLLIDAGLSNKEIALRLNIGVATAKKHVHNILEKLHVTTRGEAAARLRARPSRLSERE